MNVNREEKMKKLAVLVVCGLLLGIASPLLASQDEQEQDGLFGEILLGGGWGSSRPSGLEVLDDNERLNSLSSRGSRESDALPFIGGSIGYAFARTGTTLSIGSGLEEPLNFTVNQKIGAAGQLSMSAFYTEEEVWKNPYLTGVVREKTDAESVGLSVTWEDIFSTGIWLSIEQMYVDVDQDLIGQNQADLRRDGTDSTVGVGFSLPLGEKSMLTTSINYMELDRDGESNSAKGFGGSLAHSIEFRKLSLETAISYSQIDYDKIHQVFNKTREETSYGISHTVVYAAPFNFEDWALIGMAAYSETDANIAFFDSSGVIVGTGLSYSF